MGGCFFRLGTYFITCSQNGIYSNVNNSKILMLVLIDKLFTGPKGIIKKILSFGPVTSLL